MLRLSLSPMIKKNKLERLTGENKCFTLEWASLTCRKAHTAVCPRRIKKIVKPDEISVFGLLPVDISASRRSVRRCSNVGKASVNSLTTLAFILVDRWDLITPATPVRAVAGHLKTEFKPLSLCRFSPRTQPGNPYWGGKLNTIDLLRQLLFQLKFLFLFVTK